MTPDDDPEVAAFKPKNRGLKIGLAALGLVGVGLGMWAIVEAMKPPPKIERDGGTGTRAKGEEGCPCGCDRAAEMAAVLREHGGDVASSGIDRALVTIAEREEVGYVTERMIAHRLGLLELAAQLGAETSPAAAPRPVRPVEAVCVRDVALRVCAELIVHGERVEVIDGRDKLVEPTFVVRVEVENLGTADRALAAPKVDAGPVELAVTRWYEAGGAGHPWDGQLRRGETVRLHVIGDITERVRPGTAIDATIVTDGASVRLRTEALATVPWERAPRARAVN